MGTLVKAINDSNTKPNYSVEDTAPGAVAVADGELALFVGSTTDNSLKQYAGMLKCMQALREAGWLNPATTVLNTAVYDIATDTLTVTLAATLPLLTETQVALVQGFNFTQPSDSNSGHSRRMAESAIEFLKAA